LLGTGAYGYIVEILWHLREPSLKKEKTNKKIVKTQIMKKTLGTMVAIMAVAISIGTLITAKYATAGETVRDGRFIAYDNGTVLDTSTNLMWAAKDNGSYIDWPRANKYCENYRGGGYMDWRMPTQDELAGLYDAAETYRSDYVHDVHLTKLIHLTCDWAWASETYIFDAAYFHFFNGKRGWASQFHGRTLYRALPVRSGK